mmetsp:Transcript_4825/g.9966  ORF Transcript_4825/g.9966 Transcript_4825/m.9966 type:complete len:106 (+) Transcript_4825:498-815(+)
MAVQHRGVDGVSKGTPELLDLYDGKEHTPKGMLSKLKSQFSDISIHDFLMFKTGWGGDTLEQIIKVFFRGGMNALNTVEWAGLILMLLNKIVALRKSNKETAGIV